MYSTNSAFIVREFLRNFFTTFVLLLFVPIIIEGGIDGYIWAFIVKGIPFLIISFLNSLALLIFDLYVNNNPKLSFLPTLFFFGYLFIVFLMTRINYGTVIFMAGISIAVFISNYLRFRRIKLK
jgi:hypothetical protein